MNKGYCIWFTGLPCAGKTTLAEKLQKYLEKQGKPVVLFDGDIFRKNFTYYLGFSKEDRNKNLMLAASMTKVLINCGIIVLAAFVSPYESQRQKVFQKIGKKYCRLIHVNANQDICIERDIKGMWKKAIDGEIIGFTGWDDPYEKPKKPYLTLYTDKESIDDSFNKLKVYLGE